MRKNWTWMACVAAIICGMAASDQAQARPPYNKGFWELYAKELGSQKEATGCKACHDGDDKKKRNDYGKEVGKALGGEKVTDAAKIEEALKKAEKGKSSTEGKTFGDLIKAGKLPGKNS